MTATVSLHTGATGGPLEAELAFTRDLSVQFERLAPQVLHNICPNYSWVSRLYSSRKEEGESLSVFYNVWLCKKKGREQMLIRNTCVLYSVTACYLSAHIHPSVCADISSVNLRVNGATELLSG